MKTRRAPLDTPYGWIQCYGVLDTGPNIVGTRDVQSMGRPRKPRPASFGGQKYKIEGVSGNASSDV